MLKNCQQAILFPTATGDLFSSFHKTKLIALGVLSLSLVGAKGKKSDNLNYRTTFAYFLTGLLTYFISVLCLYIPLSNEVITLVYIAITSIGFVLVLTGGGLMSRIIKDRLNNDVFNKQNGTFPQEERLLENEYSISLAAQYI